MALTVPVAEIVERSSNPLLGKAESWGRVLLGDIATIQNGFAFKSSQFSKDAGMPLIRIRDVGKDTTDTRYIGEYDPAYVVNSGDLLVGMDGDFNCARWSGEPGLLNQRVCRISLTSDIYHPKLLDYALPGYLKAINEMTSSVTVKHLSSKSIAEIPLPLPPMDQQESIVAEIEKQFSRLDEAVANLKRVKANLKRYKATVLKAAVEGKLTEEWRKAHPDVDPASKLLDRILTERHAKWEEAELAKMEAKGKAPKNDKWKGQYKEAVAPEATDLPELPESWAWARLDSIAGLKGGITVDSNRKDSTARDVPYLRVANVQRGFLDLNEVKTIKAPASAIEELRLYVGDILFNEGGDRDKLGRGWIWEGQLSECIHQNHVFRARLFLADIQPKLVSWWGNSFGKDYFLREGKQTTNLASINLTKLSAFPIPLPPSAEQHRIVIEVDRHLSLIRETEIQVDANLQRAERLRQSILTAAFADRLRGLDADRKPEPEHCFDMVAEPAVGYEDVT